jgi:hypothetical protein
MRDYASRGAALCHGPAQRPSEKLGQESALVPRDGAETRKGRRLGNQSLTEEERDSIKARITALEVEHHDLDDVIARLSERPTQDQLQLRRLKKRKLYLKDSIARLRDRLIPDIIA